MGYEMVNVEVSATLSRHNSDQDREHDALWDSLQASIERLVHEPRYEAISAMVL